MGNTIDLEKTRIKFKVISNNKISKLGMPIHKYLQELRKLPFTLGEDKTKLTVQGLDKSVIINLPVVGRTYREPATNWIKKHVEEQKPEKEQKSPRSHKFHNNFIDEFEQVFDAYSISLSEIDEIKKDRGHTDRIQDL